jgi:hypothetical protein
MDSVVRSSVSDKMGTLGSAAESGHEAPQEWQKLFDADACGMRPSAAKLEKFAH